MADGLDQYQGLRTPPVFWPMIRFMQAAAHVDAGTPGPGFALIDEAIEIGGSDTILAPLFHIVRGDLSLLGPDADAAAATASYERAFAVADELSAPGCPSSERLPGLSGWRPRRTGHDGWTRSARSTRPSRKASGPAISRRPANSSADAAARPGQAQKASAHARLALPSRSRTGLTNYLVVTKLTRMTTQTPQRTRMTADERRDAIVAAATEEFANGGLVGASTEAIARRAGVSQPYIFQLFGTKKDLFLAVIRSCFGRTRLAFEEAARTLRPGRDRGLRQRP